MADSGRWITVNGTHILVKDGQTVKQAMDETFDNDNDFENWEKEEKQKESIPDKSSFSIASAKNMKDMKTLDQFLKSKGFDAGNVKTNADVVKMGDVIEEGIKSGELNADTSKLKEGYWQVRSKNGNLSQDGRRLMASSLLNNLIDEYRFGKGFWDNPKEKTNNIAKTQENKNNSSADEETLNKTYDDVVDEAIKTGISVDELIKRIKQAYNRKTGLK